MREPNWESPKENLPEATKIAVDYCIEQLPSGTYAVFANSVPMYLWTTKAEAERFLQDLKSEADD